MVRRAGELNSGEISETGKNLLIMIIICHGFLL